MWASWPLPAPSWKRPISCAAFPTRASRPCRMTTGTPWLAALDFEAPLPTVWPLFHGLAHAPILAIRGEHSDLLSPETLDAMEQAHPGLERWIVPGQGHAPLLRDAPTVNRIASFVAAVED